MRKTTSLLPVARSSLKKHSSLSNQLRRKGSLRTQDYVPHASAIGSEVIDGGNASGRNKDSEFLNPTLAFANKSNKELLRGWAVLTSCRAKPLVNNADILLELGVRLFGHRIVNAFVKPAFYAHFCGGESKEEVIKTANNLRQHGVAPLLNYSAEADAKSDVRSITEKIDEAGKENLKLILNQLEVVNYSDATISPVKPSAICHGASLSKISEVFHDKSTTPADLLIRNQDYSSSLKVDHIEHAILLETDRYESWGIEKKLFFKRVWKDLVDLDAEQAVFLAKESFSLFDNMYEIGAKAASFNQSILIDAEYFSWQPAIDFVCLQLQRHFNENEVRFLNTFQCYLKETNEKVDKFLTASENYGFHFGAKLVRGAYMVHERQLAAAEGRESPIHESIEETHACYNQNAVKILYKIKNQDKEGIKYNVVFATHNRNSIERALEAQSTLNFSEEEKSQVFYAQLLGMADNLTNVLAKHKVQALKLVPYGPVQEVMPYLLRRAQENSSLLGGAAVEREMMLTELKRRIFS